jgi:formylglycine-generating enzyme required for sulfatase activity
MQRIGSGGGSDALGVGARIRDHSLGLGARIGHQLRRDRASVVLVSADHAAGLHDLTVSCAHMRRGVWLVLPWLASATSVAKPICPPDMVHVPGGSSGFCIDRTEVTVAAYARCVAAAHCEAAPLTVNASWVGAGDATAWSQFCNGNREDRARHPVNCVDWDDANAYCRWAGKHLPTGADWQRAAQGDDGRTYPWGNDPPGPQRLNACGTECAALSQRVVGKVMPAMFDGDDGSPTTAPVGSYPAGASHYGVVDMAGNVWEWVADRHGDSRQYRGGGWLTYQLENVSVAHPLADSPALRLNTLGFRCAK